MNLPQQASVSTQHSDQYPDSIIHSSVIISGDVQIAAGVHIDPHCVLTGPLRIDAGCRIGTGCVIGGAPEHRVLKDPVGAVVIGSGTVLREYCVVHHGTEQPGTRIGSNCYLMNRVYIGHDCQIDDEVTLASTVTLGGHVRIFRGANLGMQVAVHQHSTIGAYAMIGMSTPVNKDIPPLSLVAGNPIRFQRANQHALVRLNFEPECVVAEDSGLLYASGYATISDLIAQFEQASDRSRLFEIRYQPSATPRKPR